MLLIARRTEKKCKELQTKSFNKTYIRNINNLSYLPSVDKWDNLCFSTLVFKISLHVLFHVNSVEE